MGGARIADANFPILDPEWGITGDADGDGHEFLKEADTPCSIDDVRRVVRAGSKLVSKYGDVRLVARHIHEIHMGTPSPKSQQGRDFIRGHPDMGAEVAMLHEIGALPRSGGSPLVGYVSLGSHMEAPEPSAR